MAPTYTTIILLLSTLTCVQMQASNTTIDYRLPTIIRPNNYQLHLNLTAAAFTPANDSYNGMVIINFTSIVATTTIRLNAHHEYIRINLITISNTDVNETNYSIDNATDILTIATPFQINPNVNYRLIIDFTGLLSTTEMTGFYKSSYVNGTGATRYLATTQFQPISARRTFPCFDEPFFKATFDVYLTYPLGLNALSNTPGRLWLNDSVSETVRFNQTARMSTYLLAFVISDFTCTQGENIGPVPYRICSREEANVTRAWAVEIGPPLLRSLNNYTDFDYSLSKEKLDQVAIPDFAAGAMENWGLVTYRELNLLWATNDSSNQYKQLIANIISHEFAHFWFGNLVTCEWWSETFLNEGFANYFQYHTTHDVLPDWQLDKQYVVAVVQPVLIDDSLENALPLQSNASSPSQIMAKFGRISYFKGGSIFRMVEYVMGSNNFRAGLRNFMTTYQYATVLPEDLWRTLNASVNNATAQLPAANLEIIMENWVKNPGFPLLTVTRLNQQITVTQERFLLSGNNTSPRWYVPITYTTSVDGNKFNATAPMAWLNLTSNLVFNIPNNASWIILNNQQTGFYRVTYDAATWNSIRDALRRPDFDGIGEINRAQIIDDLFNLARVNRIQYSRVFNIIEFVTNDTSYFPWVPTLNGFNFLLARVGLNSHLGQAIATHVLDLMDNLYRSVSFINHNEDDQIYTLKQVLAITAACRLGRDTCIKGSQVLFSVYRTAGLKPNKNLRNIVYCNGLRHSTNQSDWEFLWNEYQITTLASEQTTILNSLGCSQDEVLLERYLNYSVTDNTGIRPQDALSVFTSVYNGNPVGVDVAFRFLRANHRLIEEKYLSMNAIPNLINGLAGVFTTQQQIDQLREFIQTGDLPAEYLSAANTALESAQANLAWVELFEADLHAYYYPEPDGATKIGLQLGLAVLLLFLSRLI